MPLPSALIGSTGLVGGTLLAQTRFDDLFHSRNIEQIAGRRYDTIVCAGAPAQKWLANRHPATDDAAVDRLTRALARARADRLVLISTVDVLPVPVEVDESTEIDPARLATYGRNRFTLERFALNYFDTLVVRLPGLFGTGLKKNIVFDLLHDNALGAVHADAVFQFYPLERLWADVQAANRLGERLVHFSAAPVSVREVAREAFGREFDNRPTGVVPARYDFRSRFAGRLGGSDGYVVPRAEVMTAMRRFVAAERGRTHATGVLEPGLGRRAG